MEQGGADAHESPWSLVRVVSCLDRNPKTNRSAVFLTRFRRRVPLRLLVIPFAFRLHFPLSRNVRRGTSPFSVSQQNQACIGDDLQQTATTETIALIQDRPELAVASARQLGRQGNLVVSLHRRPRLPRMLERPARAAGLNVVLSRLAGRHVVNARCALRCLRPKRRSGFSNSRRFVQPNAVRRGQAELFWGELHADSLDMHFGD
jgi:hypothetical protein